MHKQLNFEGFLDSMETAKTAKAAKTIKKVSAPGQKPLAHGVGRRKSSVARVWLRKGSGKIVVNGKPVEAYFDMDTTRTDALLAFTTCPKGSLYDAFVRVHGGGTVSQAGAIRLGTARALVETDETLKPLLRQSGLITVDSRVKERKKYGQKAARRKFQFVKR